MKCPKCGHDVRDSERFCPVDQYDCGFPNVRAAQKHEEIRALEERFQRAQEFAAGQGCSAVLNLFQDAVQSSQAVICRSLSIVKNFVSSDNELYASFYQLVGMEARRPEDTSTEYRRLVADVLLFPYYFEQIRFAALTLDGRGATGWGDCSMALREAPIRDRATVFEENSLYFSERMDLGVNRPVPPGYRATWDRREKLAAAKLASFLRPDMTPAEFPQVILRPAATPRGEDFIEVHVYGPLHRLNVERVATRKPKKHDRAMIKELGRILGQVGAALEIY